MRWIAYVTTAMRLNIRKRKTNSRKFTFQRRSIVNYIAV